MSVNDAARTTIAIVLGGLGVGGNETWALTFLRALNRGRFSPIVITLSEACGPIEIALMDIDVPIFKITIAELGIARFIWRFGKIVHKYRAYAVLSAGFSKQHLFVHAGAFIGGARLRISCVSASPPDPALRKKLKWLQLASCLVCTHEVAVSHWVSDWLKSFGSYPAERIQVIPNGCDVSMIRARADSARQKGEQRPNRVIMVARLEAAKDHETLLRAMVEVRSHLPDAELLLVGDGPRRLALESLADRIDAGARFLGSREDVPELLGSADVFVLSTHTEGLPIALIEAMAAGLPVVASEIPPCREVLDEGRAGLLFPVGDAARLAQHLLRLLRDETFNARYTTASAERIVHYDLPAMVGAYEQLLTSPP